MNNYVQRKSVRYNGNIPLEIKNGTGVTRDFSGSGLYFVTDQSVIIGEQIELVMLLEHQIPGSVVRVICQADVVRIEPDDRGTGVAVAITKHLFDIEPQMAEAYVERVMSTGNNPDDKSRLYN